MVMETTKAGTHNSKACWQDRTCLPLGSYSVWSSLPPISVSSSNNRKPVVLTVASMDYASFFRDKSFGAYSPISGMVALLGAVDGFGNLKKQLVYNGNQTACQACDEMTQSRHKNLKLQKEKRSVASKSWRFKYKYHNDMANRLVIEVIQEIESSGDDIVMQAKLIPQHASDPIEAFSHFKVLDFCLEPSLRFYSEPIIFFEAWLSGNVRTNWVHSQSGFECVKNKNNTHTKCLMDCSIDDTSFSKVGN